MIEIVTNSSYNINGGFTYRTSRLFFRPLMQTFAMEVMHAGNPSNVLAFSDSIQTYCTYLLF